MKQPLDIPSTLNPKTRDLLGKLLNRNPAKRLGAINGSEEIKAHPYFKDIDWNKVYRREMKVPEPYLQKRFEKFLRLLPQGPVDGKEFEK